MTAIYNPDNDVFMSPMADGPIEFNDALTDNPKLVNITRFGRSFSVVQIPYSFKLLIQELQTMNCVMRIITEDNINQIESMSFSNNYKLLSGEKSFASIDTSLMKGGKNNVDNTHDDDGVQLLIPSDSMTDSYDASLQQGGYEDATMNDGSDMDGGANMDIDLQNYQENEQSGGRAQPQPMTQNIVMNCNPNNDTNLEATSSENMGKEWIKMIEPESKKEYYYNEKTKETMWYEPNPAKDYEYRPPNGWYTVTVGGHDYYHNPQKNLIKMREDVTPADANSVNEDENAGKSDDDDSTPSILMVKKTDEGADNEDGSSSSSDSSGTKKIII
jgi:hypothetical protein